MPIRLTCPNCRAGLSAAEGHAGRRVKCPRCGQALLVPDDGAGQPCHPGLNGAAGTSRLQSQALAGHCLEITRRLSELRDVLDGLKRQKKQYETVIAAERAAGGRGPARGAGTGAGFLGAGALAIPVRNSGLRGGPWTSLHGSTDAKLRACEEQINQTTQQVRELKRRLSRLKPLARSKGTLPRLINTVGPELLALVLLLVLSFASIPLVGPFSPLCSAIVVGVLWATILRPLKQTMAEYAICPRPENALPSRRLPYVLVCAFVACAWLVFWGVVFALAAGSAGRRSPLTHGKAAHGHTSPSVHTAKALQARTSSPAITADAAAPETEQPRWRPFTDAGGRFRCEVPGALAVSQVESAKRSKVSMVIGEAKLVLIARPTEHPVVDAAEVERTLGEMVRRMNQLPRLGRASLVTIQRRRVSELDGRPAADLVAAMTVRGRRFKMHSVKYQKHRYDHTLTLTGPAVSWDHASAVFDRLVRSYQSIEPGRRDAVGREKPIPPAVDYDVTQ